MGPFPMKVNDNLYRKWSYANEGETLYSEVNLWYRFHKEIKGRKGSNEKEEN